MQQHPVPQNITGFEFKLVGFLTLKQFLYLSAAGVISFIFFLTFGSIIRWILIAPVVLLGLGLAFVPINGMTFDKWLIAFINLIGSPSKRIWRKNPKTIGFLGREFDYYLKRAVYTKPAPRADRAKLETFIGSIKSAKEDKLDVFEKSRLGELNFSEEERVSVISAREGVGQNA